MAKIWLVSFNQIRDHDIVTIDLLSFISCIGSKEIPDHFGHLYSQRGEWYEQLAHSADTFIVNRGNQDMYDSYGLVLGK